MVLDNTNPMMRVLYIGAWLPSSTETFVYREILALRQIGLDILVASVHPPVDTFSDTSVNLLTKEAISIYGRSSISTFYGILKEFRDNPFHSTRVIFDAFRDAFFSTETPKRKRIKVILQAMAAISFTSEIKNKKITHIHAHMAHVPTTIAMYLAQQLKISFSFTGHAADIFKDRVLLKEKIKRAVFVSCISEWHRQFYQSIEIKSLQQLPIIRCGVETNDFIPNKSGSNKLLILSVCRLVPKKGIKNLLHALHRIDFNDIDVMCNIVGDGPLRDSLESLRFELNLTHKVKFLGKKDNKDVRKLMQSAEIFVLPCRIDEEGDRDGIPVALMESMSCGVCSISGDLPAIRELITNGENGLLVEVDNTDALAKVIEHVVSDSDARHQLGQQGRKRILEEFSTTINAERLYTEFSRIHCEKSEPGHV